MMVALSKHYRVIMMGGFLAAVVSAAVIFAHTHSAFGDQNAISKTATWQQDYSRMADGAPSNSIWNFEQGNNSGWGNNELESYTSNQANVRVQNHALRIDALGGSGYTSARLNTKGKFDFSYGRVDVVAKLPTGQGIWPAIWFLPSDGKYSNQDSNWLANGEIDLAEGSATGDATIYGSAHSINHYGGHSVRSGSAKIDASKFHTYSLIWTPTALDYLVDQKSYLQVPNNGGGFKEWPYDQRFHLLLNVAVGGDQGGSGVSSSALPAEMAIASITYYPLAK